MLGSWVHPGYKVPLLDCKECIGNAELIKCVELEELLTIFIALADTCMPKADGPWPLVVPYSSIKVTKDVVKRDMQAISLPIDSWESLASDRSVWKTSCTEALREGEKLLNIMVDTKRERQKARALATPTPIDPAYVCSSCHRMCRSRIGLQSHRRKCLKKWTNTF